MASSLALSFPVRSSLYKASLVPNPGSGHRTGTDIR